MKWISKPPLGTLLNWAHPLNKGLAGFWLMNEGHGDKINDLSMNGNTGTLKNMAFPPTVASGWNPGRKGVGLQFDGVNNYVDAGNAASIGLGNTSFTIEAWFNHFSGGSGIIFGKGIQAIGKRLHLRGGQNTVYRFSFWTDALNSAVYDDRNSYVHIVITYDILTGARRIYRNGVQIASDTTTATYDGTGNIQLGAHTAAGDYFNGTLTEARIYNRALSAQEIMELYINPYGMFL